MTLRIVYNGTSVFSFIVYSRDSRDRRARVGQPGPVSGPTPRTRQKGQDNWDMTSGCKIAVVEQRTGKSEQDGGDRTFRT